MKQDKDLIREQRLEGIESVRNLDHIGADGANCRFLIYLNIESPTYFGTDTIKSFANETIEHIIMRSNNINQSESIVKAIKEQPILIVEDFETLLVSEYQYIVIH